MKALVIGSPDAGRNEIPERFRRMIRELLPAGIRAAYSPSLGASRLADLLGEEGPDLVFCAPTFTEDPPMARRIVHGLLEEKGFPYVGSGPAVLELALDKAALKARWLERGVRTPGYLLLDPSAPEKFEAGLAAAGDFPYIVKPAKEGNSRGIGEDSVVRDEASLRARVGAIRERFGEVLVERFLGDEPDIREFTVALIGNGPSAYCLPAEIRLKRPKSVRVITTADKDEHGTAAGPVEEPLLRERLAAFASRAFQAAGLLDYARCDILMAGGELFAIEINGQPMLPDRWFEACARGGDFDTRRCLGAIFLASISRQRAGPFPSLPLPTELIDLFSEDESARLRGFR